MVCPVAFPFYLEKIPPFQELFPIILSTQVVGDQKDWLLRCMSGSGIYLEELVDIPG